MKIGFLLQRRFAYIGHDLAIHLKNKYGVNDFCGYVYLRDSFNYLKKQKDINYVNLILDEDIHEKYKREKLDIEYLKKLEQEYGLPNLWPYIALDRVLMYNQLIREYPYNTPRYTHEEMLRIFQVKARAIIDFMETEKPNAFIFPNNGGIGSMLLYQMAKKKKIKTLFTASPALSNRTLFSETATSFSYVEELFKKYMAGSPKNEVHYEQAKKILRDFRASPRPYSDDLSLDRAPVNRLQQLRFLKPKNFFNSVKWFIHLLRQHFFSPERLDYSYIHPWGYLKDRVKRKIRNIIGANDLYDKFDSNESYAFYGLTVEPEVSILLAAPFAPDQINIVRQIARSLPVGFTLYVKEHPSMVPYRPRAFYKELKKIPNVKLLSPTISGFAIIQNAKLITTISGSIGWEAMMLKKPVIIFGHIYYDKLSMVKYCGEAERLPYLVKEQLENFQYNEEEVLNFITAMLEDSALLPFGYLWEQETDENKKRSGMEPLADLIAKKLDLKKL